MSSAAVAPRQSMPASYHSWLATFQTVNHACETLYMDFIKADQEATAHRDAAARKDQVIAAKNAIISERDAEILRLKRALSKAGVSYGVS